MNHDEAPIAVHYDGGYFDKDEQGWVADHTSVVQEGELLHVDRGHRTTFRLGRRYPHARLVELLPVSESHPWFVLFDLAGGRLVGGRPPTSRMMYLEGPPRPPAAGAVVLEPSLRASVLATQVLFPQSGVAAPTAERFAADLAAELGRAAKDGTVLAPGAPGVTLRIWRRDGGEVTGSSARTDSPVGEPFAAVGLDSAGKVSLHVAAPSLEVMDAAFGAMREALAVGPGA